MWWGLDFLESKIWLVLATRQGHAEPPSANNFQQAGLVGHHMDQAFVTIWCRMTSKSQNPCEDEDRTQKGDKILELQQEGVQLAEWNGGIHLVNLAAVEKESKDSWTDGASVEF